MGVCVGGMALIQKKREKTTNQPTKQTKNPRRHLYLNQFPHFADKETEAEKAWDVLASTKLVKRAIRTGIDINSTNRLLQKNLR